MTTDPFQSLQSGLDAPAHDAAGVTPSDTTPLTIASRALWVGTGGNLQVTMEGGETLNFPNATGWMPLRVTQIWATGTTASGIVSVW